MATHPRDPTDVIGRRIGAWFIDAVIHLAINFPIFFVMADDIRYDELYGQLGGSGFHVQFNDMEVTGGRAVLFLAIIGSIWFAHHGWYQGRSGQTVGKRVAAIRVVNGAGQPPGVGPAVVRTLLVVVDGFPYVIPYLTGLIVAASSKGHRRVGDMVAGTWVVAAGVQNGGSDRNFT